MKDLEDYVGHTFVNRDDADVTAEVTCLTRRPEQPDVIWYNVFRLGSFMYIDACGRAAFDHAFPREA